MKKFTILLLSFWAFASFTKSSAQRITITIAGYGPGTTTLGFNGDGHAASLTKIGQPIDMHADGAGNIYFTEFLSQRIRKISAKDGTVSTVAGGGSSYANGIPATTAHIIPFYMCMDGSGNLYFSTTGAIRKVTAATGIITTVAGMYDSVGYAGDGGPATAAKIQGTYGVCIDAAGNLYIGDGENNRIRKVTAATGIITTIAGDGTAGYAGDGSGASVATLSSPTLISINSAGDLFFVDQSGITGTGVLGYGVPMVDVIRKISAATGVISTVAGPGGGSSIVVGVPATNATLGSVTGMCIDAADNIIINEESCSCRKIDMVTGYINYVGGDYEHDDFNGDGMNSLVTHMNEPHGLSVDGKGNVYIADYGNNRIRKIIQLTQRPLFAYGKGQFINPCPGSVFPINSQMAVTDSIMGHTETWSVINPPVNGTLAGFPYSAASGGTSRILTPAGLSYTPSGAFTGTDSFRIKVSNGTLSDTVMVHVSVSTPSSGPGLISMADTNFCIGGTMDLTASVTGGIWTVDNTGVYLSAPATLTATNKGAAVVMYTLVGSCSVISTAPVSIDSTPTVGAIYGADSVYVGSTANVYDTGSYGSMSYWSSTNNMICTAYGAGTVYGVAPGVDSIKFSSLNSCGTAIAYYKFKVVDTMVTVTTSASNAFLTSSKLVISPNPAVSQFTINLSCPEDEALFATVMNMAGEKVKEIRGNTNQPVNASLDIPAGVYLLNVSTAHGTLQSKFVKE